MPADQSAGRVDALDTANARLESEEPAPRAYLRYLDGLRGIAILAVLMVHVGQLVSDLPAPLCDLSFFGVRGVQLLLIVSGLSLILNYAGKPFHPLSYAIYRCVERPAIHATRRIGILAW